MVTRIVLIRHAVTDAGGRLCGSFDVPLSTAGRQQVQALVRRPPRRFVPDALFTSTLRRASEVACTLGRAWSLPPQPAEWAREIHCGSVEGLPLIELRREFPALWTRNESQKDETFAWPGGESYAGFRARILDGISGAAAAHAGGLIAVVTHAGVISQVLGVIRGRPASMWALDRPDPLTATEITWRAGAPGEVVTQNDREWY